MTGRTLTLRQAMTEYLEYLTHERHCSRSTRVGYQSGLRRFHRLTAERYGPEPFVTELTQEDIRSYQYGLSRRQLRPRTIRGAMHPIRGLFAFAVERG